MSPPNDSKKKVQEEVRLRNHLCWSSYQKLLYVIRSQSFHIITSADVQDEHAALRQHLQDQAGMFSRHFLSLSLLFTFVIRRTRHTVLLRWHRRHWLRPTNYELDPIIAPTDIPGLSKLVAADGPSTPSFVIDMIVGVLITSCYYIGRSLPWIFPPDLPLVEGRSMVSETICDDIVRQLRQPNASGITNQKPIDDEVLKHIMTFGEHCQRRRAFESVLRMEQGLPPRSEVWVPTPGVPPEFPLPPEDSLQKESHDWADSLTKDQEECEHDSSSGKRN